MMSSAEPATLTEADYFVCAACADLTHSLDGGDDVEPDCCAGCWFFMHGAAIVDEAEATDAEPVRCEHKWRAWVTANGDRCPPLAPERMREVCADCDLLLSFGPARDDGEYAAQVAIGIAAAKLAWSGPPPHSPVEADCVACGWSDHHILEVTERRASTFMGRAGYEAGWLARAIATHVGAATP